MRILGEERSIGIYVHIPFCKRRCPYCDFVTTAPGALPEKRYAGALLAELDAVIEREGLGDVPPLLESIYIGGGTPSLLAPDTIGAVVARIKRRFSVSQSIEVTVEVNPDSADPRWLSALARSGVTRLSIGLQSLNDRELEILGRLHDAERAVKTYFCAKEAGFENIGVDLIFGIPGQRPADWMDTLSRVVELRPAHISLYGLTIEKGTPFHGMLLKGRLSLPSEDDTVEMFDSGIEMLEGAGYVHYEISNLCLPGFESRHNMRYWKGGAYIGLGAGAHSYNPEPAWGRRWWNVKEPDTYMSMIERTGEAVAGRETLTMKEALTERVFLSLRMLREGLKGEEFRRRFEKAPDEVLDTGRFEEAGLLERRGGDMFLSRRGVLLSDEVFSGLAIRC